MSSAEIDQGKTKQRRERSWKFLRIFLAVSLALTLISFAVFGSDQTARSMILAGLLLAFIAQVVGFCLLLDENGLKAFFALTVPGYALFALNREGYYAAVVGVYLSSVVAVVAGTVLLS